MAVGDADGEGDGAAVGGAVAVAVGDWRFEGEGELLAVLLAPHALSSNAITSSANALITV